MHIVTVKNGSYAEKINMSYFCLNLGQTAEDSDMFTIIWLRPRGLTSLVGLQTFCVHRDKSVLKMRLTLFVLFWLECVWTSRSLASHTFILSFSFHGSQKNEVPGDVFSVCVQPGAQYVGIVSELALADSTADV